MKKHPYLISFIIFIIVFFIINKISKNFLEITKWEKDNRKSYVEKVYGKEQVKDYLKVIEEQTSALKYEPFIEFKEQPRSGKFVSVSQKGNRCNKNDIPNCDGPLGGKNEIWIFGGVNGSNVTASIQIGNLTAIDSSSEKNDNIGIIIEIVFGVLIGIGCIVFVIWLFVSCGLKNANNNNNGPAPHVPLLPEGNNRNQGGDHQSLAQAVTNHVSIDNTNIDNDNDDEIPPRVM